MCGGARVRPSLALIEVDDGEGNGEECGGACLALELFGGHFVDLADELYLTLAAIEARREREDVGDVVPAGREVVHHHRRALLALVLQPLLAVEQIGVQAATALVAHLHRLGHQLAHHQRQTQRYPAPHHRHAREHASAAMDIHVSHTQARTVRRLREGAEWAWPCVRGGAGWGSSLEREGDR